MLGKRQFSIAYLLLETFWIALALAFTRSAAVDWLAGSSSRESMQLAAIPIVISVLIWPIAIGGLFGRMSIGAGVGFWLFWPSLALVAKFMD